MWLRRIRPFLLPRKSCKTLQFQKIVKTLCLQVNHLGRALNEHTDPDFKPSRTSALHHFPGRRQHVHPDGMLFGSARLTGRGSLAVRQSIVKDIIMNPLLSSDKSSVIYFSTLLMGRMWPCHLRPISQPVDFLVHVTVQHWPVNGFSTPQNVGRSVNNMTTWWPELFFFFQAGTITKLYKAASWFWTRGLNCV